MDPLQQLLSQAVNAADSYVSGGVLVTVKTNYGPEVPIYSGALTGGASSAGPSSPSSPSLLGKLLGLKAAVIVRDASGRTITTFGTPPATDPIRVGIALGVAGLLAFVLLRGVLK